jgi:putative sugar O-methyltransferase
LAYAPGVANVRAQDVDFCWRESMKADAALPTSLQAMLREVQEGPAIYRPSNFWNDLGAINRDMINELGLENFKRTVAQNYFNWLVISPRDVQFKSVLKAFFRRPNFQPLLNRMITPELLRTTIKLEDHIGARELYVYKLFVGMLWEVAARQDCSGLFGDIEEPVIGRPIEIRRRGRLISQDLANSMREYHAILSAEPVLARKRKRVAELGAGYGRLGHVFQQDGCSSYHIFDIPPALQVSQWYLSRLFPRRKIFAFRHFDSFEEVREEVSACDLAFFTPNQMEYFPAGYFDIFLSISTLPEMSTAQVRHYLRMLSKLTSRYVYFKQWSDWFNPADQVRYRKQDFDLDADWNLCLDRTDLIQPLFFERLWQKRGAIC